MEQHTDPPATVPLATVVRSGRAESFHRGAVAIVWADGRVQAFGDGAQPVYARSAVKPIQALPLLELGVAEREGWGDAELALLCASHDGTEAHVAVVRGLLARGGFEEGDLLCGPHAPFDKSASLAIARSGGKPGKVHNNCSGKHAGFLWLARELGVAKERYLEPDTAGQQRIRRALVEMAGVDDAAVEVGVDGCGAPTFRLPLAGIARAFCRLANPTGLPDVRVRACMRLLEAVGREPVLLSGRARLCAALIEAAPGRLLPKNGAEGVYAVGVAGSQRSAGFGLAIKVADGNERGYWPVVVELLARLGVLAAITPALAAFHRVPISSTQGRAVGAVVSALDCSALGARAREVRWSAP
jgi:L-asparaginase II